MINQLRFTPHKKTNFQSKDGQNQGGFPRILRKEERKARKVYNDGTPRNFEVQPSNHPIFSKRESRTPDCHDICNKTPRKDSKCYNSAPTAIPIQGQR